MPAACLRASQTVASAVERGWTVLVPDHEGPDSAWLGAAGAGRGVLDEVVALAHSDAMPALAAILGAGAN